MNTDYKLSPTTQAALRAWRAAYKALPHHTPHLGLDVRVVQADLWSHLCFFAYDFFIEQIVLADRPLDAPGTWWASVAPNLVELTPRWQAYPLDHRGNDACALLCVHHNNGFTNLQLLLGPGFLASRPVYHRAGSRGAPTANLGGELLRAGYVAAQDLASLPTVPNGIYLHVVRDYVFALRDKEIVRCRLLTGPSCQGAGTGLQLQGDTWAWALAALPGGVLEVSFGVRDHPTVWRDCRWLVLSDVTDPSTRLWLRADALVKE